MALISRMTSIKTAFLAVGMLSAPEITVADTALPNRLSANQVIEKGPTTAAKKAKKKKNKKKRKTSAKKKKNDSKSKSFMSKSNVKGLAGVFLQDGSQLTFGGSYTMPFGSFYADLGGDHTSWSTEIIAVNLMRGAAGGGYAMSLSRSMLLRIGARAGLAQVSAEFPAYDEYGDVADIVKSSDSNFYAEARSGLEIDFGGSLLASVEAQLPVFGGGEAINVSAMSIYGGLGIKF